MEKTAEIVKKQQKPWLQQQNYVKEHWKSILRFRES